jgi:hypothetical protein
MGRSDAERVLNEVRRILRDVQEYHKLDETRRADLVRRAIREERELEDVMRLLKRMDQTVRRSKEEAAL